MNPILVYILGMLFYMIVTIVVVIVTGNKVLYALKHLEMSVESAKALLDIYNDHSDKMTAVYEQFYETQQRFNKDVIDALVESNNTLDSLDESYRKVETSIPMLSMQNAIITEKLSEIENRYSDIYEEFKKIIDDNKVYKFDRTEVSKTFSGTVSSST